MFQAVTGIQAGPDAGLRTTGFDVFGLIAQGRARVIEGCSKTVRMKGARINGSRIYFFNASENADFS